MRSSSAGALAAERPERVKYNTILISNDEQQVAVLETETVVYCRIFLGGEEFCIGGRDILAVLFQPGNALCSVGLCIFGERINLLAGEACAALDIYAANGAARFNGTGKNLKAAACGKVGEVTQLHSEAHIRLVRAEAVHSLVVGQTEQGSRKLATEKFAEEICEEALGHLDNIVLTAERHLDIYLCKLGLTVCAQILVAEAAGYLHITIKAGEHQQLFVELRRLRQGIEVTVMNAARHEVVACSLGCRSDEVGGLDLDKAVVVVIVSCELCYLAARDDACVEVGTAHVEITIFKAYLGANVAVFYYFKGRGLRL